MLEEKVYIHSLDFSIYETILNTMTGKRETYIQIAIESVTIRTRDCFPKCLHLKYITKLKSDKERLLISKDFLNFGCKLMGFLENFVRHTTIKHLGPDFVAVTKTHLMGSCFC